MRCSVHQVDVNLLPLGLLELGLGLLGGRGNVGDRRGRGAHVRRVLAGLASALARGGDVVGDLELDGITPLDALNRTIVTIRPPKGKLVSDVLDDEEETTSEEGDEEADGEGDAEGVCDTETGVGLNGCHGAVVHGGGVGVCATVNRASRVRRRCCPCRAAACESRSGSLTVWL